MKRVRSARQASGDSPEHPPARPVDPRVPSLWNRAHALARKVLVHAEKLLWLLQAAVLASVLSVSIGKPFDHDEFEAVHSAWKILQGERIYVDFLNQHNPLFYYLLAPVIAAFGETSATLIVIRLLVFCMLLGIVAATYKIARMLSGREAGVLSALFLSTTIAFVSKAVEIRPDVPQTLLGVWAVFFLLRFSEGKKTRDAVISSALLGIAFLFLQKAIVLFFFSWCVLLLAIYRGSLSAKEFLTQCAVFLLPTLAYLTYLAAVGALGPYVESAWLVNYFWNRGAGHLGRNVAGSRVLLGSLQSNGALWGAYAFGLLYFADTSLRKRLAFLSAGVLAAAFVRRPLAQDLLPALPLVAAVAAHTVRSIFPEGTKFVAAAALCLFMPYRALVVGPKKDNARQLQKVDYVLSLTNPGDHVYDGDIKFNVFRRDLDYFWFSVRPGGALDVYRRWKPYRYDVYSLIDRFKPAVISNYYIPDMNDPRISRHYVQSSRYADLYTRVRDRPSP